MIKQLLGRSLSIHFRTNKSRCFSRATAASVVIVATDHHGRKSLEIAFFGRQNLDMPNFGLESLDMPKFCRESLDTSLGPRPGKTARKLLKNRSNLA